MSRVRSSFALSLGVGLLAWVFSLILYSPRLTLFLGAGSGDTRRDDLLLQCLDPLSRELWEPLLAYRVVQPVLAYWLGWCGERRDWLALLGSPGIAYFALVLALACVYWALSRRFSAAIALLATFALATTQFTQWTNTLWGHPDSLTLLPTAVLMCTFNPIVVLLMSFIGIVNDERFVLALPFLLLWWWPASVSFRSIIRRFWLQALAFLVAIGLTVALRLMLTHGVLGPGVVDPYRGGGSLFLSFLSRLLDPVRWPELAFMVLLGFRWLWLLPLLVWFQQFRQRANWRSALYLASLPLCVVATVTSADISRNCSFFFPVIPVALEFLISINGWSQGKVKVFLAWILGLNILTPAAMVFYFPPLWWKTNPLEWKDWATLYLPLPVNLWQWFRVPNGAASW